MLVIFKLIIQFSFNDGRKQQTFLLKEKTAKILAQEKLAVKVLMNTLVERKSELPLI